MKRSEPRNSRDIESRNRIRLAVAACVLGGAVIAQSSATTAQGAARSFSMNAIRDQCIEFREVKQGNGPVNYRECRVSEFGEFGAVGGQVYYYAIYCLMPTETIDTGTCGDDSFSARYHRARGLAVFARDPASENARLMFDRADIEIGTVYYLKPAIIQNAAGTLLYLPIAVDGTSAGSLSEYYLREVGRWEPIESEKYFADLLKRLPAGLAIWKGVWPDLLTMQAEAGLYRAGDMNCCPTGGTARIRLAIRARQFVLDLVVVIPSPQ